MVDYFQKKGVTRFGSILIVYLILAAFIIALMFGGDSRPCQTGLQLFRPDTGHFP